MIYLIISLILYGMIPIVGLIDSSKISVLFYGLIASIPILWFNSNIDFIKKNFKEISIAAILRGVASIAYFYSFDLGYGPIVVSIIFLIPLIYAILSSIKEANFENIDLVFLGSLGVYLLGEGMPNFEFNYKLFIAFASPFFSTLALFYFKYHINAKTVKETISTVLVRNIYTLIAIYLYFNKNIEFNFNINLFYSFLYGILILGIAMVGFFQASKLIESKKFAVISNLEFVLAFFVMLLVYDLKVSYTQIISLIVCFSSILILKLREIKK